MKISTLSQCMPFPFSISKYDDYDFESVERMNLYLQHEWSGTELFTCFTVRHTSTQHWASMQTEHIKCRAHVTDWMVHINFVIQPVFLSLFIFLLIQFNAIVCLWMEIFLCHEELNGCLFVNNNKIHCHWKIIYLYIVSIELEFHLKSMRAVYRKTEKEN